MRNLSILLAACLVLGATAPRPDPSLWLQARLDRVLAGTGSQPGAVRAVLTEATELIAVQPADTLAFPRALLAMAPSAEAVDGMLAMMLSYRQPGEVRRQGRRIDPLSAVAYGAIVAGTGGAYDPGNPGSGRSIPLGPGQPLEGADPAALRRARAWQGARWNAQLGHCAAAQLAYLRSAARDTRLTLDGRPMLWRASPFARKVIDDLGAQAYPAATEPCTTRDDPAFAAIQQDLRGAGSE